MKSTGEMVFFSALKFSSTVQESEHENCFLRLCEKTRKPKKSIISLLDSIVQQWENHCLAEERSDGNRSRRFRSFYKEVFETFPNAPPLRYSEETINRALTVQHPHAQNLSYKGEGPWKKRAELRKTKLGKWLGKKVFIREAKSKKSKFTPLSETNDVPRPGQQKETKKNSKENK